MQDFLGKQIEQTIFSYQCEVYKGSHMPFIHPDEALNVSSTCKRVHRRDIVTCKDNSIHPFIREVNGLDLNISLSSTVDNLPKYIPIIDSRTINSLMLPNSIEFIGITLIDILQNGINFRAGRFHESNNITFKTSLLKNKSIQNKKVILFLSGEDTLIEWLWYKRLDCQLFDIIKEMNFFAVTGFNFSLFAGECPFGQALNIKKSLYSCLMLENNNVSAIPHVYAVNEYQLNRWIEWFKKNPKVEIFTINCQMQKSKLELKYLTSYIKRILIEIPYLHVMLQGFKQSGLEYFRGFFDRIHLADKKASKYSIGYKNIIYDDLSKKEIIIQRKDINKPFSKQEIITSNIIARERHLNNLK